MTDSKAESGTPTGKLSLLEQLLRLFTDIRSGEGFVAVLMTLNVFLLLNAYYILKTVREGLIIAGGGLAGLEGDELKIYASAGMAFLLIPIIPAYGAVASKVNRIRLLNITGLIFIGCLVVFFILGKLGVNLGLTFYLWLGIFNVFVIAQFWSYANDIYNEEAGKRLFPVIAVGGSVGAIVGPGIVAFAADYPYALMLSSGVILFITLVIYNVINRMVAGQARNDENQKEVAEKPLDKEGGFKLVIRTPYLLLIALMILGANLVNTTGEYILANASKVFAAEEVPDSAHPELLGEARADAIKKDRGAIIGGFYARFFGTVNLISFLLQAFVVSRIFKFLGVRVALFFLPFIALGAYAVIGLIGGLSLLWVSKISENSTDYSLQNTVRQALFLPTSREAKYKAKAAIDTFFVRAGDAMSALLVFVGLHFLGFSARSFAFVNIAIVVVWIGLAVGISRIHKQIATDKGDGDGGGAEAAGETPEEATATA